MRPVRRRLDLELLDERMARGCHRSATEHRDFIREEMADFVESGFYVVPYPRYDTCLDSGYPLGIKEERDRRARLVVDHTWFLINQHTLEWTTKEAMQFGGALPHPAKIYHADPVRPRLPGKYDIKDGFYRMMIRGADALASPSSSPNMMGKNKWWRSPRH
jgi:hypothetical protein